MLKRRLSSSVSLVVANFYYGLTGVNPLDYTEADQKGQYFNLSNRRLLIAVLQESEKRKKLKDSPDVSQ